jgi:hypothetical protein
MFQPHIRRRLIFAASLQLMNSACVQIPFHFFSATSQPDIRPTKADDAFASIGVNPLGAIGLINASLHAGKYYDSNTRWAVNTEALGTMPRGSSEPSESPYCGPNAEKVISSGLDGNGLLGWGTVSLRREKFISKNFYYGIGPAIQNHRYHLECQSSGSSTTQDGFFRRTERTTSEYTWEHALVGIDIGIGYESHDASLFFTKCEYLGGFVGAKVWERGKEPEYGPRIRNYVTPRLLLCGVGVLF